MAHALLLTPLGWFYTLLAFLGGRSVGEAQRAVPEEMETSIAIGKAMLVSFAVVVTGQTLFLGSVPAFADHAARGGWLLGLLFVLVYRQIVRAMEVAGAVGKVLLFLFGGTIAGINTLMAGHEVVLKVFEPQVKEQVANDGNQSVDSYQKQADQRLGLGDLGSQQKVLDQRASELRTALTAQDPQAVQLAAQAKTCRAEASGLLAALPDRESDRYPKAAQLLREKRRDCARLDAESRAAQSRHVQRVQTELADASAALQTANTRLGDARSALEAEMKEKGPVLQQSAEQGFARHGALWRAADNGLVPFWAVLGVMAAVLLLESLGMWLKLILRPDAAAHERQQLAQELRGDYLLSHTYGRAFQNHLRTQVEATAAADADGAHGQDMAGVIGDEWQAKSATRAYGRARRRAFRAYEARHPGAKARAKSSPVPAPAPAPAPAPVFAAVDDTELPQPHRMVGAMARLVARLQGIFNRPPRQATQP